MPRTKDAKGQYYHKECFERELEARKSRRAAASPEPPPAAGFESEPMSMLDEIVDEAVGGADAQRTCTSCGNPLADSDVICMNCGFNTQTGLAMPVKVKKTPRDGSSASDKATAMLHSPFIVSMAILAIFCTLLVGANAVGGEDATLLVRLLVSVFGLAIGIFVLVVAFMEGVGQGFLTLCVPFYVLYFIFGVTENMWARWLFVASFTLGVIDIFMFGIG